MHRRGRAGQIVDLVYLDEERLGDVRPERLEALIIEQVLDILSSAGEEVVQAYYVVTLCQEAFAEVRSDEAGTAGHKDAHGPNLGRDGQRVSTPAYKGPRPYV